MQHSIDFAAITQCFLASEIPTDIANVIQNIDIDRMIPARIVIVRVY